MAQQLSLTHEKCRVDPALPPRGKPRPFVLTVIAVGPHSHVLNVAGASVDIVSTSPRKTASAGIAFVPSQRPVEGLALTISASDNVSLPRIVVRRPELATRGVSDRGRDAQRHTVGSIASRPVIQRREPAEAASREVDVQRPAGPYRPRANPSGRRGRSR